MTKRRGSKQWRKKRKHTLHASTQNEKVISVGQGL